MIFQALNHYMYQTSNQMRLIACMSCIGWSHEIGLREDCISGTTLRLIGVMAHCADGGLLEIWCREFGAPGTATFEEARRNFIISAAGYSLTTTARKHLPSCWLPQSFAVIAFHPAMQLLFFLVTNPSRFQNQALTEAAISKLAEGCHSLEQTACSAA